MASKKKNTNRDDFKQEDILQAVLIADSFNVRFSPLSKTKPRVLMPLVNTPLLDYTLEFLCTAGIQQVIVFCCAHADQIKAHLQSSRWSGSLSPCDVVTIVSEDALSVGDALRDLDAKGLIKSDFVLVNGDVVSSMNLRQALEEHKARRLREKTPIMTLVCARALPGQESRCLEEDIMVAVRPESQRVLHYQKVADTKKFDFPLSLFAEHPCVDLHYDLLDCQVSICSPLVPTLFTDNFDYQTREHFIRGILVNEEILGNTIHVHLLEDSYAARVSNLQMYHAVSHDILNRWSHPMVPDGNITNNTDDQYSYRRHNVYLHKDVTLAMGCTLQKNVIVGKGSCVGKNTQIRHSVIGKNCHIGDDVSLDGVYVWDNVNIESGCKAELCLLAEGVHLLPRVHVKQRCVIADKVRLGPDVSIPAGKILMCTPPTDDFGDALEGYSEIRPELVGRDGVAYEYAAPPDSDDEGDELVREMWALDLQSDDEDDASSTQSHLDDDEDSLPASPPPDDARMFYDETVSTLIRAEEENISKDNLVLEINSLKCAYFMQIQEVNIGITRALLEYPFKVKPDLPANQYLQQFNKVLKLFLPLLQNYIRSNESQTDCITTIEEVCLTNDVISSSLPKILHLLYNSEILEEEACITWYNKPADTMDDEEDQHTHTALREQATAFITWLQEAEEESSEEED